MLSLWKIELDQRLSTTDSASLYSKTCFHIVHEIDFYSSPVFPNLKTGHLASLLLSAAKTNGLSMVEGFLEPRSF